MENYSIRPWFTKYIIEKTSPDTAKTFYLSGIRSAGAIWYSDPLYARSFSYATAMRHLKKLQENAELYRKNA